jgi:hypothetical protein
LERLLVRKRVFWKDEQKERQWEKEREIHLVDLLEFLWDWRLVDWKDMR